MAVCEFYVTGDIEKARQAVEANGGKFDGDDWKGAFSGSGVQGEYQMLAGVTGEMKYLVIIHKRPLLASCAYIERRIKEYFVTETPKRSLWSRIKGFFK